jgi:hypothetical protein
MDTPDLIKVGNALDRLARGDKDLSAAAKRLDAYYKKSMLPADDLAEWAQIKAAAEAVGCGSGRPCLHFNHARCREDDGHKDRQHACLLCKGKHRLLGTLTKAVKGECRALTGLRGALNSGALEALAGLSSGRPAPNGGMDGKGPRAPTTTPAHGPAVGPLGVPPVSVPAYLDAAAVAAPAVQYPWGGSTWTQEPIAGAKAPSGAPDASGASSGAPDASGASGAPYSWAGSVWGPHVAPGGPGFPGLGPAAEAMIPAPSKAVPKASPPPAARKYADLATAAARALGHAPGDVGISVVSVPGGLEVRCSCPTHAAPGLEVVVKASF